MTREQQATLGQIAVWVGTADELMRQAREAIAEGRADAYTTANARIAIRAAHHNLGIAAAELLGELDRLQAKEVTHE